ncbi:hypothetical protein [Fuscovulum blasticum]|uniref:hypothetical protein n=1 Tax=Fuscovulum blasticum TaxID=1075 RepID=UPI000D3E6D78|nr:hypothetical protein [Fuscovulum blasticum]AWD20687.1 hypothetical protein B6K69_02630 [Fuscovulum blasticum]
MVLTEHRGEFRPVDPIDAAIALHGARKVLVAALLALLRGRMRKARPPDARGLNNHLRADIGLPPLPPAPHNLHGGPTYWR